MKTEKFKEEYDKNFIGIFDIDIKFNGNECLIGSPKIISGPEIKYTVNKDNFRSQDFDNFNQKDFNILFSGDSFTFGDSLPEEYCYPNMIKSKLNFDAKIYNVSWSGASIHQSIKNAVAFIRKYGSPNYLIMILPISERSIIYDKQKKFFNRAMREMEWVTNESKVSKEEKYRFYKNFVSEENMLKNIDMINMLEDICSAKGINLIWSTYDNEDYEIYSQCNFNNLIDIRFDEKNHININNLPYWEVAKDDCHPGTRYHDLLSNIIIKRMGYLNEQ